MASRSIRSPFAIPFWLTKDVEQVCHYRLMLNSQNDPERVVAAAKNEMAELQDG